MSGKLSYASLQQAARWYVLLQDDPPSAQVQVQWLQWLDQHAEHRAAWQYVQRVGKRLAPLQDEDRQLATRALEVHGERQLSRRQGLKSLVILGAGTMLGWGTWRGTGLPRWVDGWRADYSTGTAQTRETVLAEGTHLWLAAISAVDADYGQAQRRLRLHFGEILVDTANDAANRPFVVDTGQGRLRAAGTRFAVKQWEGTTQLNVYRGAVEICTAGSGERRVLEAGQRMAFTHRALGEVATAQTAGESWVRHVLTADDMPLGQLVETLSRYRHGYLGCDPAIAELPVMGAFPLDDTDRALRLLVAALPVKVQRLTSWWISVESA